MRPLASPRLYIDYFDPFNAECRTYGRLKDENRQDLAVKAYGYLLLTSQQEAEVTERARGIYYPPPVDPDAPLDGTNPWNRWEEHRGLPVRAIVKEFVTTHEPFSSAQVPDLWKDLEDLHSLGILVRDIGVGNYLGGKLIDFSRSWTMPHPCLEYIHPDTLCDVRQEEPLSLDGAIVDWGIENDWNWDQVKRPQELQDCASGEGENDRYGTNPQLYDWRKWEQDLEAVDAFLGHELYAEPEPEPEAEEGEWDYFVESE
jgi:hypothetical protein